ncbi:MAG: DUF4290 domain-containing protein [Flammeovirgaceae bacterium]
MEYNTQKDQLVLKEYGRNVQKLVEYISSLESKEERTAYAHALISLMKALNPSVKENSDNPQRIWDHLYVMSNFKLDIDGPFPMPGPEVLNKRPEALEYRTDEVKFRHYGRNVELLVKAACKIEDPDEREAACIKIGKLMKSFYASWNKEVIDDLTIILHMKQLSNGVLDLSQQLEKANGNLFDKPGRSNDYHHRNNDRYSGHSNRSNNRRRGKKRRY